MSASSKKNRPRPGLGRGLGALIGQASAQHESDGKNQATGMLPTPDSAVSAKTPSGPQGRPVVMASVDNIARSPWQPRQFFDEDALKDLTDSIKSHGVIQPLICRQGEKGRYELIEGERRWRAAIQAGLTQVPVLLIEAKDRDAAELAIIANIQRENLNAIEEAESFRTLSEKFGLTQQDVADRVGKARASVANALRLLDLPEEIKQLVSTGLISTGHAKVLLSVADSKEQILIGRKCVSNGLTVRALERLIQRRQHAKTDDAPASRADMPDSHLRHLLDQLHGRFGTTVRLTPSVTLPTGKHIKGCVEIDFYDNDDLGRILTLLGITVE